MTNKKHSIGSTVSLLADLTNIVEGFIELNRTKPVIVYRITPKINPLTSDAGEMMNAYAAFQSALTQMQVGEKVQFLVMTKPYALYDKFKTYDEMATAGQRGGNGAGDNYIKNSYPEYLKIWWNEFTKINTVSKYDFYMLYSYSQPSIDMTGDTARVFIKNKDYLDTNKQAFINNMSKIAGLEMMATEEIKNLIEDCVNDDNNNIGMEFANTENLARTAILREKDCLQLGDKYCRTIYVSDLPTSRRNGFLQMLFLTGRRFRLSMFFEAIPQEKVKQELERQLKIAGASMTTGNIINYTSKEMASRYDELLTLYAGGKVSFINFSLFLTLIEDSKEALEESYGHIKPLFANLPLFKGTREQLPLFKSTLPLNTNYTTHSYTLATDEAMTVFPFYNYDISTSEGGIPVGTNILNQPVWYHTWSKDFTNGNCCVLGIPGSGKSFFNNLLLINMGSFDIDTFIVDKSKSYEFLCNINHGQYIKIDLEGKFCLNIFECADYDPDLADENDINDKGEVSANKIASIVGFFKTLLFAGNPSEWQLDKSLIESVIIETYKSMKVKNDVIDTDTIPTLSDFQACIDKVIKQKPDWKQELSLIKEKLNPYVGNRQYANLTDRKTSVDIKSSFIVFDTSGLPEDEDLQSLAVYIISNFLTKKFKQNKKKHRKQILVIDETWALARFEAGIKFLLNLAKRSRHMGLMCVFASQQINDFLGNPDAAQTLKSAEVRVFFKQSPTDISKLGSEFGLNEHETGILGSLTQRKGEYSEAFVQFGSLGNNKLYVRPNPALYWISTSDPKKDVPLRDTVLKECGNNYELALKKLTQGA
jgi:hypothetical protein